VNDVFEQDLLKDGQRLFPFIDNFTGYASTSNTNQDISKLSAMDVNRYAVTFLPVST